MAASAGEVRGVPRRGALAARFANADAIERVTLRWRGTSGIAELVVVDDSGRLDAAVDAMLRRAESGGFDGFDARAFRPARLTPALLTALCDAGLRVSLETSGAMTLAEVDPRVIKVVDVKTPGSGEEARNRYDELGRLLPHDLVKFVICDRSDYEWSRAKLGTLSLPAACTVLFSPSHEQLAAAELADWILADRLPVRFQIQLHNYLWGNVPGK